MPDQHPSAAVEQPCSQCCTVKNAGVVVADVDGCDNTDDDGLIAVAVVVGGADAAAVGWDYETDTTAAVDEVAAAAAAV